MFTARYVLGLWTQLRLIFVLGSVSNPKKSVLDFWSIKWHPGRFFFKYLRSVLSVSFHSTPPNIYIPSCQYHSIPFHQIFTFRPVSIIPFHSTKYLRSVPSVSFHSTPPNIYAPSRIIPFHSTKYLRSVPSVSFHSIPPNIYVPSCQYHSIPLHQIFTFRPVSIIPFHSTKYLRSVLSVSFYSTPPKLHTHFHLPVALTRKTDGRSLGTFQNAVLFRK